MTSTHISAPIKLIDSIRPFLLANNYMIYSMVEIVVQSLTVLYDGVRFPTPQNNNNYRVHRDK